MTSYATVVKGCLFFLVGVLLGCSLSEESTRKNPPVGFIVTPPTSYTTQKGKYLGERYHRNLERLVQQLVQNPVTRNLQFANNLMSVGGIGFFTHSATRSPDERYLEVILGLPDFLDEKADFSSKVSRLFSEYGSEVLSILAGDSEINNEKEVAGFGLNFSWRGTSEGPSGPRVVLERMVVYFSKEETRRFLARQMNQEQLLVGSVIFVLQSEGAPTLLRYASRTSKPQVQPSILKETAEKMPEVPKLEPKVREIEIQDSPPAKKKEERVFPPRTPAAKAPQLGAPKVETRRGSGSKAEKSAVDAKEAVKDTRERIGEVSRAEVKPVPLSPQTKPSTPQKEKEDRISEKTAPAFPAQKEIKDRGIETPLAGVKTPPAPPVVAETSKRQEATSKGKTIEATPVIAAKDAPSIPSAKEPKQEDPKAETRDKPSSKAKAPVTPVKESVKETRERIVEIPRAEVKPPPTAIAPQAKAPKREAPPQQEPEEKEGLKKAPTVPAQKEIKEKSLEGRTAELKPPPALPAVVETPKRVETSSKKNVTEAAPAIAAKEAPSIPSVKEPKQEKSAEKKVEKLALSKIPDVSHVEKPKPQLLRGYIVQLSFNERPEAERWSGLLNQEGYTTSISMSGEGRPVRLRVGNFSSSAEAKNTLGRFQKKGLTGLVVQLPN